MADLSALAARLDKMLATHADSMPKEAYFEVDAVMRALNAAPPAAVPVPVDFTDWLAREMPAGTVIGDPQWWAKLIARRFAQFAAKKEIAND